MSNISNCINQDWDFVIVGTGIGGGTIGYELARFGHKVLFLEKGVSYLQNPDFLKGDYVEHLKSKEKKIDLYRKSGRWFTYLKDITKRPYEFLPITGSTTGGSSALYGMVFERFFPEDFYPEKYVRPKSSDVKNWPLDYSQFRPWYIKAEELYGVKGQNDPLRSKLLDLQVRPPRFSEVTMELYNHFRKKGLHPYHMPMACEYVEGCKECLGFVCDKECKNDSANCCLKPAIEKYDAKLLDSAEVIGFEASGDQIQSVKFIKDNREYRVKGKTVILACGALHTPALLLRSKIANSSGLVGRYLMRHFFDLYSIKTEHFVTDSTLIKQLALNDFYYYMGEKLGTLQAVGKLASSYWLVEEFKEDLLRKHKLFSYLGVKLSAPLMRKYIEKNVSSRIIFTGIMEDFPSYSNRVTVDSKTNQTCITYKPSEIDKRRLQLFRKSIGEGLEPLSFLMLKNAGNNERLAHVCGTCRFGDDPKMSVLDRNNRSHDIKNLYVVDASFFPSSGGINPALTIAANSLRVADHIK